jgi:Tol biopolymer transport system component
MSPEQAKGRPADKRSDMWAFGCVLFEMLAGCAAFEGGTTSEILAGVLKTDPDWGRLPAGTPEAIRRLLRRCLRKDDTLRLRDVGDARLEIDEAQIERVAPQPDATPLRSTERLAWAGAVAVLGLLAAAIGAWAIRPVPARPEERFDIVTPAAPDQLFLASVALSPDRRTLLFVAESDGQPFLWFRALDSVVARPLPGTGGAFHPFWSPDSRSIGFFSAEGQLKRLDLDGGLVRTLTKATVGVGGDWNRDGVILFAPSPASPISRISANGGPPVALTRLGQGQAAHAFPHFLPDGRSFLYYVTAGPDTRGIYLGHLDGAPPRRLLDADAGATYTNGHLLFIRQTRVFAQAFDADRLELNGSPFQVAEGVAGGAGGFLTLSAVPGGAIAFRAGGARFGRQFVRMDRSGNQIETVGDVFGASRDGISLSPDGRRLVFFQRGVTNADLWTFDTRRGVLSRFTSDPAEDVFPIWSRDGTRIVFSSNRSGQFALYQKPTTGSGGEELLLPAPGDEIFACDMSPDGHTLLYQQRSAKTGWDIWAVPLSGDPKPSPVVQTDADERGGLLSPDGKWLAYVANDSGAFEVYVQPFPGPGPRVQVSTKGGDQIRWASSGRELFYIALDGKLTSARLQIGADGRSLNVDTPVPLFTANVGLSGGPHYVVSADGQRFLMNAVVRDADAPIRLILNWNPRP